MNPPSILITEDEIMVARDLEQRLHKFGYQVADIVDTGEEAVQKAALLHPDLVLMDIRLNGEMDGIAAAAQGVVPLLGSHRRADAPDPLGPS